MINYVSFIGIGFIFEYGDLIISVVAGSNKCKSLLKLRY